MLLIARQSVADALSLWRDQLHYMIYRTCTDLMSPTVWRRVRLLVVEFSPATRKTRARFPAISVLAYLAGRAVRFMRVCMIVCVYAFTWTFDLTRLDFT